MAWARKANLAQGGLRFEEGVRELEQDACTVPRRLVAPVCSAMVEALQDFEPVPDDRVRRRIGECGDEAHAARVVMLSRIVEQALCLG